MNDEEEPLYEVRRRQVQRHEDVVEVLYQDGTYETIQAGSYVEDPANGTVTYIRAPDVVDSSYIIDEYGRMVLTYSHMIQAIVFRMVP